MAITGELGGTAPPNEMAGGILSSIGPDDEGEEEVVDSKGINAVKAMAPSKLDKFKLCEVLKGWWRADAEHSSVWRSQAREDYRFRSGEQWTPEDRALLNSQQRPHIVFNRVLTILKAVAGMEINGRHEITFIPRNTEDTAINEVLSAASKWMSDGCDAEDEESSAFEDTATCGLGVCENRMDYVETWNGQYVEEQISPLEFYWDRTACKKNLTDARRLWRVRKMPLGDAIQMFPNYNKVQLDASWAVDVDFHATQSIEEKRKREENTSEVAEFDDTNEVTIVHGQWWELEYYWKVANLQDNSTTELSDDQYETLMARMKMLGADGMVKGVRLPRKVYKQAWLGSVLLKCEDSPVANQFTWKVITGELDKDKGTWFGLIKVMRDPQMWANKWLSQVLHIVNTTAKGGILAEEDAFAGDPREAEDKYARPDTITWVSKNAIQGGKIMAKPGQGITDGIVGLMQYAISAIRDVTGINLELLGQQDQNQPGILEHYRKQAGMTILATLFDSLRRFRKQTGSIRLYYIQNYLADGRLVRVVGPEGAKALPLLKDKCLGEYDVVIDDTPTSPNQKEANWLIIQPMLAVFKEQLVANPEVLTALLEYSPLPSRVVEMLKQFAAQGKNDPEQQKMKNLGIAKLVAGINKDQSTAEMNMAKAGSSEATAMYDVAMARHLLQKNDFSGLESHLGNMKAALEMQRTQAETEKAKAQARSAHADANYSDISGMIDAVTPTQGPEGQERAPPIDRIRARLPARMDPARAESGSRLPVQSPQLPPGVRRGKDGHHYVSDPARPGRYLRVIQGGRAA